MSIRTITASILVLVVCLAGSVQAQSQDIATVLRENQQLREENARLKAENEQVKRRIEELRKRAAGEGVKAVAVVDVVGAFDQLIEKTEFDADFKGKGDEAIAEDRKKRERIDVLRQRLDEEVVGTQAYDDAQKLLDDAVLEHQLWLAGEQGKLLKRRHDRMEETYAKMMQTVSEVARQRGFNQVMLKEPPLNLVSARPEQVAPLIRSRKVLWSSDDLDLTAEVVKRMDEAHLQGRGN